MVSRVQVDPGLAASRKRADVERGFGVQGQSQDVFIGAGLVVQLG